MYNIRKKSILIISFVFIFLASSFLGVDKVSAATFSTSLSGTTQINAGQEFTLTLNVSGSSLMGLTAGFSYDSSKLTLVSVNGLNGFSATVGSNIVLDNTGAASGAVANITFRANSGFTANQSTNVTINNVNGSDGVSDYTGSGTSATITMLAVKSSNNNLSSLGVNGTTLSGFSPTKTSYKLTVENNVNTASITASAEDSKASVSGVGDKSLSVYSNRFNITVVAENGASKVYTVEIVRKDENGRVGALSADANLSSLSVEGYDIGFSAEKTEYSLEVENSVEKLNITASASNAGATVKINNVDELSVGINKITIEVTAETGDVKTYVINVTRKNDFPKATISNFEEIATSTTQDTIVVEIKDGITAIPASIIESIKGSEKTIIVDVYEGDQLLYSWTINGANIEETIEFDAGLKFVTENASSIGELTNYADAMYLNFAYSGDLPEGTTVKVYVGDRYADGTVIKFYYFNKNENKIELVNDNVVVESGFIEVGVNHCSDYFLTQSEIVNGGESSKITLLISIVEAIVIILMLGYYFIYRRFKLSRIQDSDENIDTFIYGNIDDSE